MYEINKQRLITTFTDLASISSPSWQEKDVMNYIIHRLKQLNIKYKKYKCRNSFNLVAFIKGDNKKKSIILASHMDTVGPCHNVIPVITEKKITSDGTTVLGSDDKSAIAMKLETLEYLHEKNVPGHGPIEMLFTCAEETGLSGIKEFDMTQLKSKLAFVFDCDGRVGQIIKAAPYQSVIKITINGKTAHAGMEPEQGINAINVISDIISNLPFPHGRVDEETTMNIGTISGGTATNIVAGNAECLLEVRSLKKKKLLTYELKLKEHVKITAAKHKAKYKIHRELKYPGYSLEEDDTISRITTEAMKKIKIRPEFKNSGGGSDTNILNGKGIKAINLSCGMEKVHTTSEYIMIKDLVNGARLMLSIIDSV